MWLACTVLFSAVSSSRRWPAKASADRFACSTFARAALSPARDKSTNLLKIWKSLVTPRRRVSLCSPQQSSVQEQQMMPPFPALSFAERASPVELRSLEAASVCSRSSMSILPGCRCDSINVFEMLRPATMAGGEILNVLAPGKLSLLFIHGSLGTAWIGRHLLAENDLGCCRVLLVLTHWLICHHSCSYFGDVCLVHW